MTDAIKASIPDLARNLYRRLREGVSFVLPREATPEEVEARRERNLPQGERDLRDAQAKAQAQLAAYQAKFNTRVNELGDQLARQAITPREFRGQMLTEIRYLILTGTAIGAGGVGKLTPDDLGRVDARVKEQARYLDNWIAQIERQPAEARSAAQLQMRARMYGGAGGLALEETQDKTAFREFPNLPVYPKDRTLCRNNCKCRWSWRNVNRESGDADVYYVLGDAEHCETCVKRAAAFKPLKIRAFSFVNMPPSLDGLVTT